MFEELGKKLMGAVTTMGSVLKKKKKKGESDDEGQPDAFHLPSRMQQIVDRKKKLEESNQN